MPSSVLQINPILLGLIAGVAAPRALGRVSVLISAHNANPFNLAYNRATKAMDDAIDEHSAEAQRAYVTEVIRPAAERGDLRVAEIAGAFREHVQGRHGMSEVEQTERLNFIPSIVDDEETSDSDKVAALVLRAWQIGASASLRSLTKELPRRRYGGVVTLFRILRRNKFGRALLRQLGRESE